MTDREYHITVDVTMGHPDGPYGLVELARMEAPIFDLVKVAANRATGEANCITCCTVEVNGVEATFHIGCKLSEVRE